MSIGQDGVRFAYFPRLYLVTSASHRLGARPLAFKYISTGQKIRSVMHQVRESNVFLYWLLISEIKFIKDALL